MNKINTYLKHSKLKTNNIEINKDLIKKIFIHLNVLVNIKDYQNFKKITSMLVDYTNYDNGDIIELFSYLSYLQKTCEINSFEKFLEDWNLIYNLVIEN